jgi:hypothetical protein
MMQTSLSTVKKTFRNITLMLQLYKSCQLTIICASVGIAVFNLTGNVFPFFDIQWNRDLIYKNWRGTVFLCKLRIEMENVYFKCPVCLKSSVFWCITPCSVVESQMKFRRSMPTSSSGSKNKFVKHHEAGSKEISARFSMTLYSRKSLFITTALRTSHHTLPNE